MGAWKKSKIILLPGFSRDNNKQDVLSKENVFLDLGVDLGSTDDTDDTDEILDMKVKLGQIKDDVIKDFDLKIIDVEWENVRKEFIDSLRELSQSGLPKPPAVGAPAPTVNTPAPTVGAPTTVVGAPAPVVATPTPTVVFKAPGAPVFKQSDGKLIEIVVGNIIEFGGFGTRGKNLEWRVLEVDTRKWRALLITKDIIEKRGYHDEQEGELRDYLNDKFYNDSFLDSEKSLIAQVQNANPDNPWYEKGKGCGETLDRVFLLSLEDVVDIDYFGSIKRDLKDQKRWGYVNGKYVPKDDGYILNDENNSKRVAKYKGQAWWWWLRSPGYDSDRAAHVYSDGALYVLGYSVNIEEGGVRPALWLNLKS
jgi:hypothetical protein